MIKRIKVFLKNNNFIKNSLMVNPLKKTFLNRKEVVKKIWNNQNTNKNKIKTKSSLNNPSSILQLLIKKFNIPTLNSKSSKVKKNKDKRKIFKKEAKSLNLFLSEKLKTKFSLKTFLNSKLDKRFNSFRKISKINSPISKIDLKTISSFLPEKYNDQIKNLLKTITSKNINKSSSKKITFSIKFLGISYVDNVLSVVYLERFNKKNIIKDIVNINIPGDLIGDYKVEKIPEVKRIIDDVINIFGLKNPPIILFLSSSFFTARTFSDSELVVFSEEDPIILSKSPFLPDKTLVQYKRVNGDKNSSYHRVIYANKEAIDSWMNVITLSGSKIATVTCGSLHLIEKISSISEVDINILCDIGDNSTTLYLIRRECELITTKLPFGSSIYITGQESLNNEFFSRIDSSIKKVLLDNNFKFDSEVYISGNGIDKMLSVNNSLKEGFTKISNINYEIDNKELNLELNQSLLNSFSNVIDIISK